MYGVRNVIIRSSINKLNIHFDNEKCKLKCYNDLFTYFLYKNDYFLTFTLYPQLIKKDNLLYNQFINIEKVILNEKII